MFILISNTASAGTLLVATLQVLVLFWFTLLR